MYLTAQANSDQVPHQLALRPSQEIKPIPYGLVSLWDMINFSFVEFYWLVCGLNQYIESNSKIEDGPFTDGFGGGKPVRLLLERASNVADELGAGAVKHRIDLITTDVQIGLITRHGLCAAFKVLLETLEGDIWLTIFSIITHDISLRLWRACKRNGKERYPPFQALKTM